MQLHSKKPHKTAWLMILVILTPPLLPMLVLGGPYSHPVELQLHDTYIVTNSITVRIILSILSGIIGFFYWRMKDKKLIDWLTTIHLMTTIGTFVYISFLSLQKFNDYQFAAIAVAVVSQLIFVANLVISSIRDEEKE